MQTPTLVDTTFDYNPTTGLLERVKDDLNRTVREYFYDGYRRLTKDKDGLNFETLFAYDNHGNTSAVTDQLLKVWSYSNDVLGRVLTTTGPISGMVWTNVFDAATGLQTEARDPRNVKSTVEFDSRGQVTRSVAADGSATPQVALAMFDAAGQSTGVRDGEGFWSQAQYDMRGREIAVFDQAGSVTRSQFDYAGQTQASQDPQGFRTGETMNNRG